jgi:hypothetical protein
MKWKPGDAAPDDAVAPDANGELPVTHRGISLSQLRQVRSLCERLGTANLFKITDLAPYVEKGTTLHKNWVEINQHHIRYGIIMKVIQKADSCSWVELVADRVQKPKYFVSHNWSESFRDFMLSIEHHAKHVRCRAADSYWICVFAMNQWEVDVGGDLEKGPFVTALKEAPNMVLMLDKEASSLSRLWCLIEVYLVTERPDVVGDKAEDLQILTPLGVLGTPGVQSGPVFEALKGVKTSTATATEKPDRRQLLNYIGGMKQTDGLMMDDHGCVQVPKAIDCSWPDDHEDRLVQEKAEEFLKFDKFIHDIASRHLRGQGHIHSGWHSDLALPSRLNPEKRGMTLAQLRAMWRKLRHESLNWKRVGRQASTLLKPDLREIWPILCRLGYLTSDLKEQSWKFSSIGSKLTIYDVETEVLAKCRQPDSLTANRSYMEMFADGPREPEYFVTVSYATTFEEFMSALEWHAEARGPDDNAVYWGWFFSLSLDDLKECFSGKGLSTPTELLLNSGIQLEGFVQILDKDMQGLSRPNVIRETWNWLMGTGARQNVSSDLCCSGGALSTRRPFPNGSYQFGLFPVSAAEKLTNFDTDEIIARLDHKSAASLAIITEKEKFNKAMRRLGYGPVLRHCAVTNDSRKLHQVAKRVGINMLSPEIIGIRGETPLMLASSLGHVGTMECLLRYRASVSETDTNSETPLHYAALGGHLDAAKLLVKHGARVELKSGYEETALQVATQNAAFFIGVDTRPMCEFLEEEMTKSEERLQRMLRKPQSFEIPQSCASHTEADDAVTNYEEAQRVDFGMGLSLCTRCRAFCRNRGCGDTQQVICHRCWPSFTLRKEQGRQARHH